MVSESVPQDPRVSSEELLVCQAKALIRELWPDEFDVKPKLTLIQGGRTS